MSDTVGRTSGSYGRDTARGCNRNAPWRWSRRRARVSKVWRRVSTLTAASRIGRRRVQAVRDPVEIRPCRRGSEPPRFTTGSQPCFPVDSEEGRPAVVRAVGTGQGRCVEERRSLGRFSRLLHRELGSRRPRSSTRNGRREVVEAESSSVRRAKGRVSRRRTTRVVWKARDTSNERRKAIGAGNQLDAIDGVVVVRAFEKPTVHVSRSVG